MAALLHLLARAAIKSSLFLGAGVFQHDRDSTDMDALAGAGRARPKIFAAFAVSALALAGIPPLAGFFSKDAIIAAALAAPGMIWLLPLALAGTVLTGAYMARALGMLWRGDGGAPSGNVVWMGAGIGVLVVLVVVLGAGFAPLENLLQAELGVSILAMALGLGAAIIGLTLGWFVPMPRLLGPIRPWAQRGFVLAGGFDALMLRPAMAIAQGCEAVERVLYNGVLSIGRLNLSLGLLTRKSDEQGIDAAIFALVARTIAAGGRVRRLQSGFIHKQLAMTIIGTGVIIALLLAAPLFS